MKRGLRPYLVTKLTTAYKNFDELVKALQKGANPIEADLRYKYNRKARRKTVAITEVDQVCGCVVEDRHGRQLGYIKSNGGNLEFWTS